MRELVLLLGVYGAYLGVRAVVGLDVPEANAHALALLRTERFVGWDVEGALARATASVRWLSVLLSFYYATAHYLVTPLVLAWMWRGRAAGYSAARNVLLGASGVALAGYALFPTTPPRLLTGPGVTTVGGPWPDVLAGTADVGWWDAAASAPAVLADFSNQYAAMPSMHAGWALWCLIVVARWGRRRAAGLVAVHCVMTIVVVVATGNHWILDVVAGLLVVAVADGLARRGWSPEG